MQNIGGQVYSCADCEFQHLDWERMESHVRTKHNRAPHCGPDAAVTPENIYVGAVLLNHKTGERVRVLQITDRENLQLEVEPLQRIEYDLFEWNEKQWLFG